MDAAVVLGSSGETLDFDIVSYHIELDKLFVADGNIVYGTHETSKFVERTLIDFIL
jgi:hypothetical protein